MDSCCAASAYHRVKKASRCNSFLERKISPVSARLLSRLTPVSPQRGIRELICYARSDIRTSSRTKTHVRTISPFSYVEREIRTFYRFFCPEIPTPGDRARETYETGDICCREKVKMFSRCGPIFGKISEFFERGWAEISTKKLSRTRP